MAEIQTLMFLFVMSYFYAYIISCQENSLIFQKLILKMYWNCENIVFFLIQNLTMKWKEILDSDFSANGYSTKININKFFFQFSISAIIISATIIAANISAINVLDFIIHFYS